MNDRPVLEAAVLAMTVVKNEANDRGGTWTVDDGAARFLEVLHNKGWVIERQIGLRENPVLDEIRLGWARGRTIDYSEDRSRWMARAIPILLDLADRTTPDLELIAVQIEQFIEPQGTEDPDYLSGKQHGLRLAAAVVRDAIRQVSA